MQLTHGTRTAVLALGFAAAGAGPALAQSAFEEPKGGTLLRLFTDSDKVSVRAVMGNYAFSMPKDMGFNIHWNNERVLIPAVAAPVGSAEAVDAITTASRPISGNAYSDFIKVRNEFQGALSRPHAAFDYYYSQESDYVGQMLGARFDRDFMNQQLNLSVGSSYGWDAIQPLADDDTQSGADHKNTLHLNAVATQVLTASTVVRYGLEYNAVEGLQHNPYRHVYAGGTNVPERHPDRRQRRDAFVKVNQFIDNRSSLKAGYRLYTDDWGIVSHELDGRLSQYITEGLFARYQYRWYTQTPADFHRDEYISISGVDGYRTGDYRLAELSSHLFGFSLDFDLGRMAADTPWLRPLGVVLSYERYFNSNNYSADILETGIDFRF